MDVLGHGVFLLFQPLHAVCSCTSMMQLTHLAYTCIPRSTLMENNAFQATVSMVKHLIFSAINRK